MARSTPLPLPEPKPETPAAPVVAADRTVDELPRTEARHDAPRVDPADLPPEAWSSPAPPTSVDVVPPEVLPPDGRDPLPPVTPPGERRAAAVELIEQRRKAEAGDPDADHDRLWELHYKALGQTPPGV